MNEQYQSDWHGKASGKRQTQSRVFRHAAILLWVAGGLQAVLYGLRSAQMLALGLMTPQQLHKLLAKSPNHSQQVDQLVSYYDKILPMAIVMIALLVVPALWLIWLGLRVRQGKPLANRVARGILYAQSFLAAIVIFASFLSGSEEAILVTLLVFGSLLGVLIAAARACLIARDAQQIIPDDNEPWNE